MDCVLKTRNLTKTFGEKSAVKNINMIINKGDIYGLIGKNGAGKTTLMRLILSLATPTSGDVELFGSNNFVDSRGKVGSLIESPGYYKGCTARENIIRFASLYGVAPEDAIAMLVKVGLKDVVDVKVSKFSLGMKQKLGIAIALLGSPEFVILDEPVNGLDPEGMVEIRNLIQKLNRDDGVTFLISSHLLGELSKAATRYGIIKDGELIEEFSLDENSMNDSYNIIMKVDSPETAAAALTVRMPELKFKVDKDKIIINSTKDVCEEVNTLFVKDFDIVVHRIEVESKTIEDYFLERVGVFNE